MEWKSIRKFFRRIWHFRYIRIAMLQSESELQDLSVISESLITPFQATRCFNLNFRLDVG